MSRLASTSRLPRVSCSRNFSSHRPSAWVFSKSFLPKSSKSFHFDLTFRLKGGHFQSSSSPIKWKKLLNLYFNFKVAATSKLARCFVLNVNESSLTNPKQKGRTRSWRLIEEKRKRINSSGCTLNMLAGEGDTAARRFWCILYRMHEILTDYDGAILEAFENEFVELLRKVMPVSELFRTHTGSRTCASSGCISNRPVCWEKWGTCNGNNRAADRVVELEKIEELCTCSSSLRPGR